MPGTRGDGRDAQFAYNDIPLKLIEYVRVSVSGGNMSYNPVFELRTTMRTLCNDLRDRSLFVNIAIDAGIHRKAQPARLPDNIYGTAVWEWELYSTPSRDARIKTAFAAFHEDLGRMIEMWRQRDKRIVYDGLFLDEDLQEMYAEESAACNMTYRNSRGTPVTLIPGHESGRAVGAVRATQPLPFLASPARLVTRGYSAARSPDRR